MPLVYVAMQAPRRQSDASHAPYASILFFHPQAAMVFDGRGRPLKRMVFSASVDNVNTQKPSQRISNR
ncbi:hypothetical protein [Luteibacter sp. UNCMF331Sha3.1]|uniref:hypothetical protein n=1 Tax=Luteibacter sp. UNCMF331Sha3.1 TaxID=1502760 RepID=UPI000B7EACE5|nr:hypothetical protein [Luteibacter sp. UNCMF331Sha3.1]